MRTEVLVRTAGAVVLPVITAIVVMCLRLGTRVVFVTIRVMWCCTRVFWKSTFLVCRMRIVRTRRMLTRQRARLPCLGSVMVGICFVI